MLAELDESGLPMDKLGLFLRVLKHIYDENFLEIYENLVPALLALDRTEGDRGFVIAVNRSWSPPPTWKTWPSSARLQ